MSNLWLNIRFGSYHLQCSRDRLLPVLRLNSFWVGRPKKWFRVYQLFGRTYSCADE